MLVVLFIIIILIILILSCVKIVPQAKSYVIECLGSYEVTWNNGLHFKIPFFERVANVVSKKELVADFPPQDVITKDNVTMKIDTVVYYKIFDARLFTYGVENPIMALANLTATTLRNIIGDLELDQTLTSREIINTKMREIIDLATDAWGIKVNRIELKNIIPPREIQQAMEKQMKAEREKRQTLLEAEAHKESVVSRAEGDKQAKILAAEAERDSEIALAKGKAESIRLVYEAEAEGIEMLKKASADEGVLTLKKLEALKAIGDGRATKIFMPTELASAATGLGLTTEMLGIGNSLGVDTSPKNPPILPIEDECCDDKTGITGKIVSKNREIKNN
jgi:regulator of protease activity HflC (stomatin/prohibitin superfamily)